MKASIITIGNSRGIRIPKPVFEQCGFEDQVELEIRDGTLVIHSSTSPRNGWDKDFSKMAQNGDDALFGETEDTGSQWDKEEWEW